MSGTSGTTILAVDVIIASRDPVRVDVFTGPSGAPGSYDDMPIASTTILGGIKVDGVTTSVSSSTGILTVIARLG